MADIKVSQLTLFSPTLTDEVIVNDVDTLTTKRSTLESIRNLANINIDDTSEGSLVTGKLETSTDLLFNGALEDRYGNTVTDLSELTSTEAETIDAKSGTAAVNYLIFRETESGYDSSNTFSTLTFDASENGLLSSNAFAGDGKLVTNVDSARHSLLSDLATLAETANVAKEVSIKNQDNINLNFYPTFVESSTGNDSVSIDPQLSYNPFTGQFGGDATEVFFVGDGSLLENVSGDGKEIRASLTDSDDTFKVMFRMLDAGLDSTNIDTAFTYNPATNRISGTTETELFLYGGSQWTNKTYSNERESIHVKEYVTFKGSTTGLDSVATIESFFIENGTVTAAAFAGDGTLIENVNAATALTATNVNVIATSDPSAHYLHFGSVSGSAADGVNANANLRLNPSTLKINTVSDTGSMYFGADSDVGISLSGVQYAFQVVNNGSSFYTFTDTNSVWFPSGEDNPTLYLRRGDTYRFDITTTNHPFEIRLSNGGAAYTTGVVNNGVAVGYTYFSVPMSAPSSLYYQCTIHSGMGGVINVV